MLGDVECSFGPGCTKGMSSLDGFFNSLKQVPLILPSHLFPTLLVIYLVKSDVIISEHFQDLSDFLISRGSD